MDKEPHIRLLATGGTIANPPHIDGYLSGDELLESIPEIDEIGDVSVEDVSSTGSSGITPDIWYRLHSSIHRAAEEDNDIDGIVISHGSNTLEETAYFLNLTLQTGIPVVLTAALRNHSTVGNDGNRNLVDAIRVAAHPNARDRGVLVVVNDTIHHARDVTKTVSGRPDSWSSGDFGALGLTDKRGAVRFYRSIDHKHTSDTDLDTEGVKPSDFFNTDIIYSAVGDDGSEVREAVKRGTDGIVVAALPTGTPMKPVDYGSQKEELYNAVESDVPVVISHRGYEGWPNSNMIEGEPFIWSDTLSPQKSRILLTLGLSKTDSLDELQGIFLTH